MKTKINKVCSIVLILALIISCIKPIVFGTKVYALNKTTEIEENIKTEYEEIVDVTTQTEQSVIVTEENVDDLEETTEIEEVTESEDAVVDIEEEITTEIEEVTESSEDVENQITIEELDSQEPDSEEPETIETENTESTEENKEISQDPEETID